MTSLAHKDYVLPEVDLSHDEGDPDWHAAGGKNSTPNYNAQGEIISYTWTGLPPGHYAEYFRLCVAAPWEETVRRYEEAPGDVFSAWTYADAHPVFWHFGHGRAGYPVNHVAGLVHDGALVRGWPEITPHRVCPATSRHEDDEALNTATEWWHEFGPEKMAPDADGKRAAPWHDYALDGGAATYEDAVIALARVIHDNYGNDRAVVDSGPGHYRVSQQG